MAVGYGLALGFLAWICLDLVIWQWQSRRRVAIKRSN